MDTKRFILVLSLGLVMMMLWQEWQNDYGQPRQVVVTETGNKTEQAIEDAPSVKDMPVTATKEMPQPAQTEEAVEADRNDRYVLVTTDVFKLEIDLVGGTLRKASLLKYPLNKNNPDVPLVLLDYSDKKLHIAQSGLLSRNEAPNHNTIYQSSSSVFNMGDKDKLSVELHWQSENGVVVTKSLLFHRGSYLVEVIYRIENNSNEMWQGSVYGQLQRTKPQKRDSRFINTYTGAVVSSPDKRYEKISFNDMEKSPLDVDIVNGWAAMLQHYFISALIPGNKEQSYHYYTKVIKQRNSYAIGTISPMVEVMSHAVKEVGLKFYFGLTTQKTLNTVADGLELTVDYGKLWFIAKPLFWVLDHVHTLTNNWGLAIIILTVLIKVVFYRLSAAGYRSMANMRRVQPRIMSIRERYKNDKQRLNQAMMEIYKEEKINPLGGCFPILIQIPVFISLYWVLIESVEMRQADFALWINDLSSPDPYFVLPLIMGVTMFVQQKLNPAPMDPVQEKVMSVLPVVFTVFFAFFPSGLVLYWVVNNSLSIVQQWLITRSLEKEGLKR